ncbi:hypothetical protein UA08_03630 [Talaromyces atroroseus]|uniref:Zinc/iron permease n=1 Tax=Talaromyces atroroseus TaxID=1441469 RepID=A0A225AKS9_TALAT|nr:hypothetical protein UA08_03630 [Talaromyces atroroseus]OKL61490.1 hypothetical protein UA08_03630 [Talaromyces atroroseus]
MGLDARDARGWVMSGVAGIACVVGASIICVDVILRSCCGIRNFDITTNRTFLSSSMSLSAGIMIFSSLYSMLPTAKKYLARSGLSSPAAAWTLIGLFLAGVIIISIFSSITHRYIPSHVVDCTHTHGEEGNDHHNRKHQDEESRPGTASDERTPLLPNRSSDHHTRPAQRLYPRSTGNMRPKPFFRDSVGRLLGRRVTRIFGVTKDLCDEDGPCYGFSQTCGTDCRKVLGSGKFCFWIGGIGTDSQNKTRAVTPLVIESDPNIREDGPDTPLTVRHVPLISQDENEIHRPVNEQQATDYFSQNIERTNSPRHDDEEQTANDSQESATPETNKPWEEQSSNSSPQHHHHVPQNAFLSIGLQTSLAIALHKLPEGFITYATNHASPTLGLTVFIALFIHNITDGFALALPLFLAIRSRTKAIFWASLLGGISQPAGAGLAALWIWYTDRGKDATEGPSWGVYGGMFAATAGIMTSVGLHLFSEGLSLTHNPNICIISAIAGMGLLGISFALTA